MQLWSHWWTVVWQLRPACSRLRTFLWFATCLAGMAIRLDGLGVTSLMRALGLKDFCYDRLLDFFHSQALNLEALSRRWVEVLLASLPFPLTVNGRIVLVGDGLKVPKSGRKMPAVKCLHQQSEHKKQLPGSLKNLYPRKQPRLNREC